MATFTDTIRLVLNMDVDKTASSSLKTLKTDIDNTDGAWGKMKVGAGGAMDFVKNNATGLALGAGAAVAAFATKAVVDFQNVALAAGKFSDATGVSTEDASRFIEVAKDLGIGVEGVEKTIGFMNRTLGQTPEKFAAAGVEIVRTKDGAVDVAATFANVVDVLDKIEDPSKRAAVAQQLLGRSWMQSAELIASGADGVKAALAGVEDAKVMSPAQVAQAKAFRDTMDELQGVLESFTLTIGQHLVPVLTDVAGAVKPVVEGFGKVRDAAEKLADVPIAGTILTNFIHPFENLKKAFDLLPTDDEIHDRLFGEGMDDIEAAISPELLARLDAANTKAREMGSVITRLADAFGPFGESVKQTGKTQEEFEAAVKASAAALHEQADALNEQIDAMHGSADATVASDDAQREFAQAVHDSMTAVDDSTTATNEKADAEREERDAAIDAANAAVELGQRQAEAAGKTQSATGKVDTFNSSLLANAHFATPAARDAIADYILEANGIPASKGTDIKAAIQRGDFDTAARLLGELSAARSAAINADANTAQADRDLDAVAHKPRTSVIQVITRTAGAIFGAKGFDRVPAGGAIVGENYRPEIVNDKFLVSSPTFVPAGAKVTGEQATASLLASGLPRLAEGTFGGEGGVVNVNVSVNVSPGANPVETGRQVYEVLLPYLRTGGAGRLMKELSA